MHLQKHEDDGDHEQYHDDYEQEEDAHLLLDGLALPVEPAPDGLDVGEQEHPAVALVHLHGGEGGRGELRGD